MKDMKRRTFLGWIARLPVVGALFSKAEPEPDDKPIEDYTISPEACDLKSVANDMEKSPEWGQMNEMHIEYLRNMQGIRLSAGDVLVVRPSMHLTPRHRDFILLYFRRAFPKNKVLILEPGTNISVIKS